MKGFLYRGDYETSGRDDGRPLWESLVVNAVGHVIEFWGFKQNHGRIWALLYLRREPWTAAEIREALGLSKGAVSMATRDLERFGVLRRVDVPGDKVRRFVAEVEFIRMVGRVLREREMGLVARVREDLAEAEERARADGVDAEVVGRIRRMRTLAELVEGALNFFLKTARLDIGETKDVL